MKKLKKDRVKIHFFVILCVPSTLRKKFCHFSPKNLILRQEYAKI